MSESQTSLAWPDVAKALTHKTASRGTDRDPSPAAVLSTVRTPGVTATSEWLYAIGLVIGFIHLADVLAANAESATQFIPAVFLWIVMLAIWVFDRGLRTGWTAIVLIPVAASWTIGGVNRHVMPLVTTGDEPAAVTGAFSTLVGLGLIAMAVISIVRWRREVRTRRQTP